MEKNFQIIKRENESLEKVDKRPVLLVNDIAKLVNSSALIKPQYKSVKIGDQIWMLENLNVAHYRNGDLIPEVKDQVEWGALKTGGWCYYDNNPENGKKYGKLYNWYAVDDPRGLAPEGWHIPTIREYHLLIKQINDDSDLLKVEVHDDGNALKAIGQGRGMNRSGFSALLAGFRNRNGEFVNLDYQTYLWSSTEIKVMAGWSICIIMSFDDNDIFSPTRDHAEGFSIRCLKD